MDTNKLDPLTKARVDYIVKPWKSSDTNIEARPGLQITELVSVLSNEPSIVEDLVGTGMLTKSVGKTVVEMIKDLIDKAYKWFATDADVELLDDSNLDTILGAIQELDSKAKVYEADRKSQYNTKVKAMFSKPENKKILDDNNINVEDC